MITTGIYKYNYFNIIIFLIQERGKIYVEGGLYSIH